MAAANAPEDPVMVPVVQLQNIADIDAQIRRRLSKIDVLNAEIRTLQNQVQTLVPIARLPDEILGHIFLQYAQDCRAKYEGGEWNDYKQQPNIWMKVTFVCRRWRGVALDCPRLWDWILPMRPTSTQIFISRSGARPLTIPHRRLRQREREREAPALHGAHHVLPWHAPPPQMAGLHAALGPGMVAGFLQDIAQTDFGEYVPLEVRRWLQQRDRGEGSLGKTEMLVSLELLYHQLHRIERIDVSGELPPPTDVAQEAPMLRSLTIRNRVRNTTMNRLPTLEFFKNIALPALTKFCSWCGPQHLDHFIQPNVTSLTLSARDIQNGSVTVLLDLLSGLPELQHFSLYHSDTLLPPSVIDPEEDQGNHMVPLTVNFRRADLQKLPVPTRVVNLPKMRSIQFVDRAGGVGAIFILKRLAIPMDTVSLKIDLEQQVEPKRDVGAAFFDMFQQFGPPRSRLAVALRQYTSHKVELSLWHTGAQLDAYTPFEEWGAPRFSCSVDLNDFSGFTSVTEREKFPHAYVAALVRWLPAARVSAVYIDAAMTLPTWHTAFEKMVHVEQLHVRGRAIEHLADALRVSAHDTPTTLFNDLGTLALGKASWQKRGVVALPGDVSHLAQDLAFALASRGGLQQVVIRRADGGREGDASHLVNVGNVPNVDRV